jgi:hypothetical protein
MSDNIDWLAVSQAMYRSKYGRATESDIKLCQRAWRLNEKRYAEEHKRMQAKVFDEMTLKR